MRLRNLITSISSTVVTWASQWSHVFGGGVSFSGAIGAVQAASIAAAAQTVTPAAGTSVLVVTAATNDAFTIALPAQTAAVGQRLVIIIFNNSGGAMGAITFNAAYFFSAFTTPANQARRAIEFICDGTNWVQLSPAGVDLT